MAQKHLSIIGGGTWGLALAEAFKNNNIHIIQKDQFTSDNLKKLANSDYIFIAVPTQSNREVLECIQSCMSKQIIILCSKGIEQKTNKFVHEIASEYFPHNSLAIISGPNFAHEIANNLPAITTIATNNIETATKIAQDLNSTNFSLYPQQDILSTAIFGALKNVIAIACGISMGLCLGENYKAAIITRFIIEIQSLIKHFGGDMNTIISPAGIGDIILTCGSNKSRNTSYGISIVNNTHKAYIRKNTVEGYYTLESIYHIAKKHKLKLPIITYLYNIIYEDKKIEKNNFIKVINS